MTIEKFHSCLANIIKDVGGKPTGVALHPKDFDSLTNELKERGILPSDVTILHPVFEGIALKRNPASEGHSLAWEWVHKDM